MTTRRILLASAIVFVLFGYPGFLRGIAADELFDSRTGQFSDWGSPILTEVWRLLGFVFAGPAPMFVLQGGLLLGGSYALLRRQLPDRRAAWGASLVLLFPPLLVNTARIGEDALLPGLLVSGFALVLEERLARKLAGGVLLVLACGMQAGAAIAVVPLVLAVRWTRGGTRWRGLAVAGTVCVAIAGLAFALDRALVDVRTQRQEVALAMVDVAGTIAHSDLDDAALQELHVPFAVDTQIRARAKLAYARNEVDRGKTPLFLSPTEADADALLAARRSLSLSEPAAYLEHRLHELAVLIGMQRDAHGEPIFFSEFVQSQRIADQLSHMAHHSLAQKILIWPVRKLSRTRLFRPYLFFIAALVLLGVAIVRERGLAAAILTSGIAYELVLAITTAHPSYSDSQWLMVAVTLAAFSMRAP